MRHAILPPWNDILGNRNASPLVLNHLYFQFKYSNFNLDNKDIEIVKDFAYLGSVIYLNGDCREEIKRRLRPGRTATEELGKIIKSKDMSLDTTTNTTHTLVFQLLCTDVKLASEEG